jgi:hypothetical protein
MLVWLVWSGYRLLAGRSDPLDLAGQRRPAAEEIRSDAAATVDALKLRERIALAIGRGG